VILTYK